ncbi:hypothetical protein QJS10_CPA03g00078 [Acorus calamus]|uniref:Uncharacterized protein n=1 Tax=Acorus calamus TaxID=4465 RepID=A0AAV9F7C2_ACOCL|nr:hypothetical protein QJS10_CPA03g00078 [Acorus calamus]
MTLDDENPCELLVELLEENWFYESALNGGGGGASKPPPKLDGSSSPSSAGSELDVKSLIEEFSPPPNDDLIKAHGLLRTPSLPPNIGGSRSHPKLKHSFTSLDGSLIAFTTPEHQRCSIESRRTRPPTDVKWDKLNNYSTGGLVGDRTKSEKKCRSLSDLEFEELKGFRDLGFVFDRERLNPRIAMIIPGLRRRSVEEEGMNGLRRPYLSEAWVMQRSAPPELNLFDRRSAAEMKEQLRFWARTVAFNIRQEC